MVQANAQVRFNAGSGRKKKSEGKLCYMREEWVRRGDAGKLFTIFPP